MKNDKGCDWFDEGDCEIPEYIAFNYFLKDKESTI